MADYTGSFSGSFQGTISGSLLGSGIVSGSTQIDFNSIVNKPTTIQPFQANSIVSNNRFREVTYPAISSSTSTRLTTIETNASTLSTQTTTVSASTSTRLTTVESNVSTLQGQIQAAVSGNVPPGTISGSTQIAALGYLTSASAAAAGFGSGGGAATDISALNTFTASIQSEVNALRAATSSYLTSVPSGTVSSSTQITNVITNSYISASAAASGFGSGGGETYTAGLGITITSNVITLNTSSTHFIQGVSASAAASGFGSGGGSNAAPTIADQSMSAVPESSSAGYSVGLITATDAEGNTITFASFTIANVFLNSNPSVNLTSSLGGTSLYDPSVDPFQANSSGVITRKNSVFLNADVADRYVYVATATDAFATTSGSGFVTIPISQHQSSSIGNNGQTYFIIESATGSDNLTINSNGRIVVDVTFSSAVTQSWVVNSTPSGYVRFTNGTTQYTGSTSLALELAQNISGSGLTFDSASTIGIQITASETSFETTKQFRNHTLNIAKNFEPSGSMVTSSANLNTNGARSGNTIATLTWTDVESNTLNNSTFTLTSNTGLSSSWNGGYVYTISPTGSVSAGTYFVSASVKDQHGFRFGSSSLSFTIVEAGAGTLNATGGFFVLESATGSDKIVTNTNGRPTGTQVDLNVTYSPQFNSAAVAQFTSSNALIAVSAAGLLTVGTAISGSGYLNSGSISSSITFRDQYNNITSSNIFVTVTKNYAPEITFTNAGSTTLNTNAARSSSNPTLSTITFSDVESNALNHNTFTFTNPSGQLSASRSGDTYLIKPLTNLSASVYQMTASIKDIHGFNTGTKTNTFTITQAPIGTITAENFFIIESAVSGNFITHETDGSGSSADVNVSYSDSAIYGSPVATNFSASDAYGLVYANSTSGVLSIKQNISGSPSAPSASTSFVVSVNWNDQYQNNGSGSITLNITPNYDPSASFAPQILTAPINSGSNLESVSIIDREAGLVSMSLSGQSAGFMNAVRISQTPFTASYQIQANTSLTASTLLYTASIFDSYGNSGSFNRSLVINAATPTPSVFVYASSRGATQFTLPGQYATALGDGTSTGRPLYEWRNGYLGTETRTLTGTDDSSAPKMQLIFSGSGTDLVSIMSSSGNLSVQENTGLSTEKLIYIVYPSSSDLTSRPLLTGDGFSDFTFGKYLIWYDAGGVDEGIQGSVLTNFTLDASYGYTGSDGTLYTAGQSYTNWSVMGVSTSKFTQSNVKFFVVPTSGSDPTP